MSAVKSSLDGDPANHRVSAGSRGKIQEIDNQYQGWEMECRDYTRAR